MYYQNYNQYNSNMENNPNQMYNMCYGNMNQCEELECMYPDTYKMIYPMICSACDAVQMPVTRDLMERMTDDICTRVELQMNERLDIQPGEENRQRNRFLNDLVSILLIREFLHRRPNFPNRPHFPIMPFWGF